VAVVLAVMEDKYGVRVTCAECQLDWCFPCHAPWHAQMKCVEFRRGDKLLKAWAREQHYGQANAQKCPKCKVMYCYDDDTRLTV